MDPITSAIMIALASDLSKSFIKDGYEAIKAALKKKFGEESDVVDAVNKLEKSPEREDRKATLETEVKIAKVNDDPEIVKLAQELLKQIKPEDAAATSKYKTEFQAEVKGAQIGEGNTQENTFN